MTSTRARCSSLVFALALARGDGRYARLLKTPSRVDLLILDDWGLAPLTGEQRRDLLEVVDDRHQRGSTIITSQVPIENWHEVIADPTIADAVLDRLVHNAHRLDHVFFDFIADDETVPDEEGMNLPDYMRQRAKPSSPSPTLRGKQFPQSAFDAWLSQCAPQRDRCSRQPLHGKSSCRRNSRTPTENAR